MDQRKRPHLGQGECRKSSVMKEVETKSEFLGPRSEIGKGMEGRKNGEQMGEGLSSCSWM